MTPNLGRAFGILILQHIGGEAGKMASQHARDPPNDRVACETMHTLCEGFQASIYLEATSGQQTGTIRASNLVSPQHESGGPHARNIRLGFNILKSAVYPVKG